MQATNTGGANPSWPDTVISDRLTWQYVAKWLIAGVVTFLSIGGGIYAGTMTSWKAQARDTSASFTNSSYLDVGESFPDYPLLDPRGGGQTSVAEIVAKGPAVLLFVSTSCGACQSLIGYWDRKVVPGLSPEVQLVLIYDHDDWYGDPDLVAPFDAWANTVALTTDRVSQWGQDGITSTPTLVGVGRGGAIRFLATGFDRRLSSSFINENL